MKTIDINLLLSRILSLQDNNPLSPTYGCLDRNYWHFKTIIDFPSATYQQAILGLAELYTNTNKKRPFSESPVLKDRIVSGLMYWCKIQNKDGSLNEYYQNDHSFCPTAFTAFAAAKTFYICENLFNDSQKIIIKNSLLKAGNWLSEHSYPEVQNQMIASMNALYFISMTLKNEKIKSAFLKRRSEVLNAQDEEGWFSEYNGADIGYSFVAIDLFANYLEKRNDKEVLKAVEKLLKFIINFIHPDGTIGSTYGSRCTSHIMPYGIIYFSQFDFPEALELLEWYNIHNQQQEIINPLQIDDKYFSYFYFNSYAKAACLKNSSKENIDKKKPHLLNTIKLFNSAGLLKYDKDNVQVFLSWKRKGVNQIYFNNNLVYADTGYIFELSNKTIGATQVLEDKATIDINNKNDTLKIKINGHAGKVDMSLPLVKWIIPFKIFCKTILRWDLISYWFNANLKKIRVNKQYLLPISISRNITISSDKIKIEDHLTIKNKKLKFKKINLTNNVTTVHSPSSRFLQYQNIIYNRSFLEKKITKNSAIFNYSISLKNNIKV